jgi:hypothetical protein
VSRKPRKPSKRAEPSIWEVVAAADPKELPGGTLFQDLTVLTQRYIEAAGSGGPTMTHAIATALAFVGVAAVEKNNAAAFRQFVVTGLIEQLTYAAEPAAIKAEGGAS